MPNQMMSYPGYLARECKTGFLFKLIALVLSKYMGAFLRFTPKTFKVCFCERICTQLLLTAMHSAFAFDKTVEFSFLLNHEIIHCSRNRHVPLEFFLPVRHPAKLPSEYPSNKFLYLGFYKLRISGAFKISKKAFLTMFK